MPHRLYLLLPLNKDKQKEALDLDNKIGGALGIEEVLRNMKEIPSATLENKIEDGKSEFEFINESAGGGLIFEYEPTPADIESAAPTVQTSSVFDAISSTPAPALTEAKREEERTAQKPKKEVPRQAAEEFSIPDAFAIDSKYDTPETPDTPTSIWTTYVPRFTEISEKYRMVDDPRPRREERSEERISPVVSAASLVRDESETSGSLDPTAELDDHDLGTVVEMSRPTEDEDSEKLSVFKFSDAPASDEASEPRERTVEDEIREIERLIAAEEESEPETADEVAEEIIEESFSEPEEEEKIYTIPDPAGDRLRVVDYASTPVNKKYANVAPEGASDKAPENTKRGATEFTHPLQRDGFKDKFLDTIMSVKIRLFAALFFFVLLVTYETLSALGVIPETVLSGSAVTGALAIYDLLFAASLFVFAIPETARAFRNLAKGKPTPELFVTAGFIVTVGYSLVVIFGSYSDYALFGSVFGIYALTAILSSFLRAKADFRSFKLISQNKEKRIFDKQMTRTLPEENIALDGLIDEYKSKTARIFRAGFITDFFSKTSKTAEKPRQTLLPLAVSSGVALVVAAVSFFLADGIISAAEAFSLVFLLGIPSALILDHKLAYYSAQRAAAIGESTVVGETSYIEFSDVDVIAFEDTEIFGPDDVNLKRFMLYGDSDNMERVMRQMCSLFSVVGGPLYHIFTNSLDKRVRYIGAEAARIEEDGISGNVDGKRISAGTEDYMRRHGVAIPEGAIRAEGGIDTTKIMYASEDGEVTAKFYIRYSFSEEFTMILPTLKQQKIVPLIYTRDPNVSNELLKTLSAGADCMRVMKRLAPGADEDKLYGRVSAGVVTYGDKMSAIDVLLLSKDYKRYLDGVERAGHYAMSLGMAVSAVLSVLGMVAAVPSFVFALWQLVLVGALSFAAWLKFLKGKKK